MNRPSFIGNYLDFLDEDNACYSTSGSDELLSIGSAVGKKLGLIQIGIHVETLPPGRRTSWPHAESDEEEFGFVLEGNPDVWINGTLYPLKPGDFVAFPSGTGIAHSFLNNSSSVARILVGGEANKAINKITYPLHQNRNDLMKSQGRFWDQAPVQNLGTHDGMPSNQLNKKWNVPTLETVRLILRPFEIEDAPHVFKYASNPNVAAPVTWFPHKTIEDSKIFISFAHTCYLQGMLEPMAVCFKNEPKLVIGTVGAFWSSKPSKIIEVGAVLDESYWGQGIIPEALEKLIEVTWSHYDVVRIQGRCKVGNSKSRKMMEKLGMNYEGTLKSSLFCKGESWDMEMFSLIRA
jgi:uncharacterized cupin superfamily protein/RimJ/RimL family protein N-acetyltransferase